MSKESIIDEVLRVIYSSKSKTTLTKNQVKADSITLLAEPTQKLFDPINALPIAMEGFIRVVCGCFNVVIDNLPAIPSFNEPEDVFNRRRYLPVRYQRKTPWADVGNIPVETKSFIHT